MSAATLPIWRDQTLSFAAKMTWLSFHAEIPVTEEAWRDFLAKMGKPYASRDTCLYELRTAGWMAEGVRA